MAVKISRITVFLLLSLLLVLIPANAAADPARISAGNTIFIGEQGLDISPAMGADTKIGWWGSAASLTESAPSQTMTISNPTSFYVTSAAFVGYTGNWYRLNPSGQVDGLAFNVQDPQIAVRVMDDTLNLDRTNDWFPRGDFARFAIDSNLDAVFNQRGGGAPILLRVVSPDGAEYSSLIGPGGSGPNPVTSLIITSNPYLTLFTWDTGNPTYPQGTYTIWAECNLNGMKDNYAVNGKSISNKITILNQDVNPLITSSTVPTTRATTVPATPVITAVPSTPVTTMVTTVPATPVITATPVQTTIAPISTTTRAPGFEFTFALCAVILVIGVYSKKK